MFALEEVSSYWSQSLTWRTFFSCLMATFTVNFIVRGFSGIYDLRSITIFNVGVTKGYHIYEVPIFALIGICGGIMGGVFNRCNVALAKWRRDWLHKSKFRMAVEVSCSSCLALLHFAVVAHRHCHLNYFFLFPNDC